jgi:hypothetical protein
LKHFNSKDWSDFVRGLAAPEIAQEMEQHAVSCESCSAEKSVWTTVSQAMSRERSYQPPAAVVRVVKAAVSGATSEAKSRVRIFAQLVSDSFKQPGLAAAGVRGTMSGARQLLYRAGPIVIDMRLEERENDRHSLVGQVLSSENSEEGMNEMPVHLLCGRSEIANTRTNLFGEFHLEYDTAKDLQVFLELSQSKDVFIPLDESIWRMPSGN